MTEYKGEEYMSPEEASAYVGVSRQTVDRWAKNKKIGKYTRGEMRGVFYKRSELDRMKQMRPQQPQQG